MVGSESRFDTIHACDRQTDRRTDGTGVPYTSYSIMLSRVKMLQPDAFCEHTIQEDATAVGARGSASDPAGGAYSVPQTQ